jgi:hypothetical protein
LRVAVLRGAVLRGLPGLPGGRPLGMNHPHGYL